MIAVDDVMAILERKERAQYMKGCLEQLPKEERTLIWLFYYEELSLKEIMDITSYSQTNLKVKLHRARKRLLSVVQKQMEPEMISHYGK